jgi:predicted short-subunit dehydrogenase-like oxidoreductase (DUF2520 family)
MSLHASDWSFSDSPAMVLRDTLMNGLLGEEVDEMQSNGRHMVCEVTFSIMIERRNLYHIFNYIVMQLILVVLSWCTFSIDPANLDARLGISLTLLLAINVFQARSI